MKLGVYLRKLAVFTQKKKNHTRKSMVLGLSVRTTGQICKSVPLLFARSPFGADVGGVEIYQYPIVARYRALRFLRRSRSARIPSTRPAL